MFLNLLAFYLQNQLILTEIDWMHRSRASWVSLGLEPGRTGGLRRRLTTDTTTTPSRHLRHRAGPLGSARWPGPVGRYPGCAAHDLVLESAARPAVLKAQP